jgi:hypothetical protein
MDVYCNLRIVATMYFRNPEPSAAAEGEAPGVDWGIALACAMVFVLGLGPGATAEAACVPRGADPRRVTGFRPWLSDQGKGRRRAS